MDTKLVLKSQRLKSNMEFARVFRKGKHCASKTAHIQFINNNRPYNRVGYATSKHYKTAVIRNKIKRQLREIYRQEEIGLKKGYDLILIGKAIDPLPTFSSYQKDFKYLFKKANLFDEETKFRYDKEDR